MRIGIFGGSFNPIHRGHVGLARKLVNIGAVDEVWFMVSPLNPLKQNRQEELMPDGLRLKLARLATERYHKMHVSDFEMSLPLPSYTWNTLSQLCQMYPEHEFSLIVGQDNFEHFDRWFHADDIRKQFNIFVYARDENVKDGSVTLYCSNGNIIIWDNLPLFNISGTQIRKALRAGNVSFLKRWLHPAVLNELAALHHLALR